MGGGILSRCNLLHVFFDVCQSKMHPDCGVSPVSKAMAGSKKAMVFRQQSYAILMGQHSCTVGAGLLHYRCQGAALFLALLFESLYSYESVGKAMLDFWFSYAGLLVQLCWTFGTRMLYSSGTVFSICLQTISRRIKSLELRVKNVALFSLRCDLELMNLETLNCINGFPFGRRTLFLHSTCCLALCKPAATELKIKKRSRIARMHTESFTRIRFLIFFLFDLSFDFLFDFDCALAGQEGFKTDSFFGFFAY